MRYQSVFSLLSHLKQASPDHICPYYLVIAPDEGERKQLLRKIAAYAHKDPPVTLLNTKVEELIYKFSERTFFDEGSPLLVVDYAQALLKPERKTLLSFLEKNSCQLILGISSKEEITPLYTWFEKMGVILELPKKNALYWQEWLHNQASLEKKKFTQEALQFFVKECRKDFSTWEQETQKLFCYVGDKELIEKKDVEKTLPLQEKALWMLASKIVWHNQVDKELLFLDEALFFPLLSLLRKELKMGWKMALLLENKVEHLSSYFPNLWPKLLEERKKIAQEKRSSYFKKGLLFLFEIEFLAKDGVASYGALMVLLSAQLYDSFTS